MIAAAYILYSKILLQSKLYFQSALFFFPAAAGLNEPHRCESQQQGQYYNQNQQNPYNKQGQYYQQRTKEAEWLYNKKDQLVAGTKNMFSEILPILKAPVTRVKAIADSNNPAVGIEFIATKMVVCLIFLLIVLLKIRGAVSGYSSYLNIKIPYFKSILCVILATAGIDVIDAVFLKVITALFGAKARFQAISMLLVLQICSPHLSLL